MIGSVLVANRGEIARRIIRTCGELGVGTVAVYADADAEAPHTREATAAVRLPGRAPADTYLRGDLIVEAALASGADAVHPGYGFLSESAEFARAVLDADLVWIGPSPAAIATMASKTRAKELMDEAGVPSLAPIPVGEAAAEQMPLLVKAAAGGGGRGMRVVRELSALQGEVAAARSEAAAAFGDGEVFVEPYVERGRHVEVQVLADRHGTVWVLGTRDCSLQRRHQKVVEEAPAPRLDDGLRAELHRAAERAARAVAYEGAGTVEFLVAEELDGPEADGGAHGGTAHGQRDAREREPDAERLRRPDVAGHGAGHGAGRGAGRASGVGRAYFLEMNTRLQVEHPVTEAVFGLDLVAEQIRVAEGEPLDPDGPPAPRGHAVEARLYAENPARDWQPQTGTVHRLEVPSGVRVDSGVEAGSDIGVHYDAMLAKAVAWAPTRREAVRKLAHAVERARVHGPVTNRELLVSSLRHPEFLAARMDTAFYGRHLPDLLSDSPERPVGPDGPGGSDRSSDPNGPGRHIGQDDQHTAEGQGGQEGQDGQEGQGGAPAEAPTPVALSALAAALADAAARASCGGGVARMGGWRNVPSQPQVKVFRAEPDGAELEVRYRLTREGLCAESFSGVRLLRAEPSQVWLEVGGVAREFEVSVYPDGGDGPASLGADGALPGRGNPSAPGAGDGAHEVWDTSGASATLGPSWRRCFVDSPFGSHTLTALPRLREPEAETNPGSLLAPMPGTVVRVADGVALGAVVDAGQPLLWLEAMKMEHRVVAPVSGTLSALPVETGSQVEMGAVLAVVAEPASDGEYAPAWYGPGDL